MVSVVVVSYNTREKLLQCLGCIEAHHEVIVVDNASTDGSVETVRTLFPHVTLIANAGNVGFGVANNQGCEVSTGDWVLFLNSDAYADPGAIDLLVASVEARGAVGGGGMLLNSDRSLQESIAGPLTLGAVFLEQTFLDRVLRKFGRGYWRTRPTLALAGPTLEPVAVHQVMGACLLVRAVRGKPVEGFDPRYFLYCEDTDLCLRLRRHGEILYVPQAKFVHDLGSSSAKDPAIGIRRYNWGKELFFRLHRGSSAGMVCVVLDRLGAVIRGLGWILVLPLRPKRAFRQIGIFLRVLTSPLRPSS